METRKALKVTFKDGHTIHYGVIEGDIVSAEIVEIPEPSELFNRVAFEEAQA